MLTKFSVKGFKSFKNVITIDLTNDISIVCGDNNCGKTNLIYALYDIAVTVNRKDYPLDLSIYKTLGEEVAEFIYVFNFDDKSIICKYSKSSCSVVIREELIIDGVSCVFYDWETESGYVHFSGMEGFNDNLQRKGRKWGYYNIKNTLLWEVCQDYTAVASTDKYYEAFKQFVNYVQNIHMICEIEDVHTAYEAHDVYKDDISHYEQIIHSQDSLKELESFLALFDFHHTLGISKAYDFSNIITLLATDMTDGVYTLPLSTIASKSIKQLIKIFCTYKDNDFYSLILIDDMYSHFSENTMLLLLNKFKAWSGKQVIVTIHNNCLNSKTPFGYSYHIINSKTNSIDSY